MPVQEQLVQGFFDSRKALIDQDLSQNANLSVVRKYTFLMDQFIRSLFRHAGLAEEISAASQDTVAVMALGSYGRRELCLGSDVDLMVIHQGKLSQQMSDIIARSIYPLWDAKLEVGHSILTVQECIRLCANDFRVLTSVMDGRFLLGSQPFFLLFEEAFWSKLIREKNSFLKQFLIYNAKRSEKFHTEAYLVEPDIKEGSGGLRDLHFMSWMAKLYFNCKNLAQIKKFAVFSYFEFDDLVSSAIFLLRLRNHLHALTGRKEDRLYLPYQQTLSKKLGYEDGPNMLAAEKFMRDIHLHINRIHYSHEEFISKSLEIIDPLPHGPAPHTSETALRVKKGNIIIEKGRVSEKGPTLILKAFNEGNRLGLFLDSETIWESKKIIQTRGEELVNSTDAKKIFLKIILNPKSPKIIRLSLEVGLIGLFIPEFNNIRNLAELGYYHVETVDLHSIRTIEILNSISMGYYDDRSPLLRKIFQVINNPEFIYLAALLHDIGKGYGVDHCLKGELLTRDILVRIGVSDDDALTVSLLVKNHLLLAHISQHRNLNDEKTCVQVAESIHNEDFLNMLLLLTVADSLATGPAARGDWKMTLLMELFFKVRRILKSGVFATADATRVIEDKKRFVRESLKGRYQTDEVLNMIDQVPSRYFLNITPLNMLRHFEMALTMGEDRLRWHLEKLKGAPVTRIVLCTYDRPGLFSKMVGVLFLNNITVLSANIFTLKNGLAFDVYEVTNPLDPYSEEERWKKIHKEINQSLSGDLPLDDLIEKKGRAMPVPEKSGRIIPREVNIDNDVSDFFTVIEVRSPSVVGLLYELAKRMFSLGLNIRFARFYRDKEYMSGDFYVRDSLAQKIHDPERISRIRQGIIELLG
ncbi:Bifunctional uridylyltransferase/uridylyl-removing enzyme [uncultured Desulfobacterium sp.]|uniref:Bifunctional uridylyltransferase/uridylyl-removing enzyme n=1 Tax=uncultured Desulfobacterium sp. TaxID=201089 RepID=A0A445N1F8_9BACT|nr:Bifunctional uridylyltransferase/uridylyl-removing enzyme [uncultured Desulfobacterium sp.]